MHTHAARQAGAPDTGAAFVQRKCSCAEGSEPACEECKKRKEEDVVQTRLIVSSPADRWEREAEAAADAVMRPGPPVARHALTAVDPAVVSRQEIASGSAHEAASGAREVGGSAPTDVVRSGGERLPTDVRAFMERRLGHDLESVRIHADGRAVASARSLGARAYTAGDHVVFGAGEYAPGTRPGRALLAHELAHVVQQTRRGGTTGKLPIQRVARFEPPVVERVLNVAERFLRGEASGSATPVFNGAPISREDDVAAAVAPPTMRRTTTSGHEECSITSVGTNVGSAHVLLPISDPWTASTTTDRIAAALERFGRSVPSECSASHAARLVLRALPSQAAAAAGVETHENRHVSDYRTGFDSVVGSWDQNLERDRRSGTRFIAADCEGRVFQVAGGTPAEVGGLYFEQIRRANEAFHATGSAMNLGDVRSNSDCSEVTIDVRQT